MSSFYISTNDDISIDMNDMNLEFLSDPNKIGLLQNTQEKVQF